MVCLAILQKATPLRSFAKRVTRRFCTKFLRTTLRRLRVAIQYVNFNLAEWCFERKKSYLSFERLLWLLIFKSEIQNVPREIAVQIQGCTGTASLPRVSVLTRLHCQCVRPNFFTSFRFAYRWGKRSRVTQPLCAPMWRLWPFQDGSATTEHNFKGHMNYVTEDPSHLAAT